MLLLSLSVAVAVLGRLAAPLDAFFSDCPASRAQRVGSELVVDVLAGFYNDLNLVEACTESRRPADYRALLEEMRSVTTDGLLANESAQSAREAYNLFAETVRLLEDGRPLEAHIYLVEDKTDAYDRGWRMTYFEYLQAEAHKAAGNFEAAFDAAMLAFLERSGSLGVSMNELERLDGLLALRRVAKFNLDVDRLYGLRESPNLKLLPVAYALFKDDLRPLDRIRSAMFDRLFWTSSTGSAGSSSSSGISVADAYDVAALDPAAADIGGRSVSRAAAEGVLCEFAQKLAILEVSSAAPAAPGADYGAVMAQLRELDPRFARELDERVVRHVATDIERARRAVRGMWVDLVYDSPRANKTQAVFVGYFNLELWHGRAQADATCNLWRLTHLQEDMDTVEWLRQRHSGVSLDLLAELQAKFVLTWLRCFRERVRLAYGLDGRERPHILAAKRALYGNSCQRTLPSSAMFRPIAGRGASNQVFT